MTLHVMRSYQLFQANSHPLAGATLRWISQSPRRCTSLSPPYFLSHIFSLHFLPRGGKQTAYCLWKFGLRMMQGGMVECPLCKGYKKIGCPTCGGGGLMTTDVEPRSARRCANCSGLGLCTCTVCSGEGMMPVVPF